MSEPPKIPLRVKCIKCNQWKDPYWDKCIKVGEHSWVCEECQKRRK